MDEAQEHAGAGGADHHESYRRGARWHGRGGRHEHGHGHGGHGEHGHGISVSADRRYLWSALLLILGFMLGEVTVAVASGSLALLSDAGHMLSDAGAIAVALWVTHVAQRPAHGAWTYGFTRSEILSGLGNGLTILVVALVILVEAVRRLMTPPEVEGVAVVVVAVIGIVVNLLATWLLAKANRSSLNIRGAYQHILTDLYGFIGTAVAGVVILVTHWTRADAIASILVAGIMVHAGWGLVRDAGRVLLEAAPANADIAEIRRHMLSLQHVRAVHDLHVWSVGSQQPVVSAHLVVDEECFTTGRAPEVLDDVQGCLSAHFDIAHSTLQFEPERHAAHERGAHRD